MSVPITSEALMPHKISRRKLLTHAVAGGISLTLPWPVKTWIVSYMRTDICLSALTRLPAVEKPLHIMREFQFDTDREISRQIYRDIAENKDLLGQLRQKFGSNQKITFTIEKLAIRLLYVPELRKQYRTAYEHYCRNISEHIFQKTQTINIYRQIVSPDEPLPLSQPDGVFVFLVHQLGKEYRATCLFKAENGKTARYLFEGACFSSRLGAVEVMITSPFEGAYQIERRKNTIWQNNCRNLYSLLQVPVEETLHYIIGPYTDAKILAELKGKKTVNVAGVERLANDWMMVEEAVVGGLGYLILKTCASKYGTAFSIKDARKAWQKRSTLPRYKFLQTGIKLASRLGFRNTFKLYKSDPAEFRKQLLLIRRSLPDIL
ncbi:MAG: hypothetical protein PVI90_18520 [Desulfobacteraceae bacterium]|jgi:hypothetical protein